MAVLRYLGVAVAAASLCIQQCVAQAGVYTDDATGIQFQTWSYEPTPDPDVPIAQASFSVGMVLPPDALTKDANEYVGLLRCSVASNLTVPGWCGISHGASGQMTAALLLMAWSNNGSVYTSLRYTPGYNAPGPYTGNATVTQISSKANSSMFELIYRCQGCFSWNQAGAVGNVSTSSKLLILGRAAAKKAVVNPTCPDKISFGFHDNGYGQFGFPLDNATHPSYLAWAAKATKTVTTDCSHLVTPTSTATTTTATATDTATPTPTEPTCATPPATKYDYIIVGAGAGGIPMADKLSQAGKSVLLIEKGPPSSGRYNGTMKPAWLASTNLTRFDVPGLCNEIWVDSNGIACTDTDQMEGCVLGGGTAVNAGLWWKPNPKDWDYNFPAGWKNNDLKGATDRVFSRIPGTWHPSMDGNLYRQEGFNVLAGGFNASGWKYVIPNDHPDQKNFTYGHTTFMFSGGERGGPLATYLVTASQRPKFTLWMNTAVKRVIRDGGHVTGVEVECNDGGFGGVVNVTQYTGRVILSAGTFGSAKLLLRSGIGPTDQLNVVQGSLDGPTMINSNQWIKLPVGYNLMDHLNTDLIVSHPDVVFYDFYQAWDKPFVSDENAYLQNRSGILAQAAPNIGPMMWNEILGSDGIVRQLQWTSRVEGNDNVPGSNKYSMTMSQYLGRGVVSRGRMTIQPNLNTLVYTHPYLHDEYDKEAVIIGVKNVVNALSGVQNLTWVLPPPNVTIEAWVNSLVVSPSARRSNHWMGTNKMGVDDGRAGGSAVVDVNTKVYGTDNLFVVDAGIFPGMPTGNPSAMIVIAAEQAAQRILALANPRTLASGQQCGGKVWTGSFTCQDPLLCTYVNRDYSVCLAAESAESYKVKPPVAIA